MCEECGSENVQFYCHPCEVWICSVDCNTDHARRDRQRATRGLAPQLDDYMDNNWDDF